MTRRAFTLVEIMIALPLGLLVVSTALAGFRVVSQSVATANRLHVENQLFRAALFQCLDEFDFWRGYDPLVEAGDAPDAVLRQPGRPFAPLGPDQLHTDYLCWQRGSFYGGNAGTWDLEGQPGFGNYGLVANAAAAEPGEDLATAQRNRFQRRVRAIIEGLGNYAAIEYLGPNAMFYAYADDQGHALEVFSDDGALDKPRFYNPIAQHRPRLRWGSTNGLQTIGRRVSWAGLAPTVEIQQHYLDFAGIWNTEDYHQRADSVEGERRELLPQRPPHWPELQLVVKHYHRYAKVVDVSRIRVVSPLTGKAMELNVNTIGTTLRGARQQRGLDRYQP
jgi:type II secretory pathway pseudopilin PulG